jgi:hypothetical protein
VSYRFNAAVRMPHLRCSHHARLVHSPSARHTSSSCRAKRGNCDEQHLECRVVDLVKLLVSERSLGRLNEGADAQAMASDPSGDVRVGCRQTPRRRFSVVPRDQFASREVPAWGNGCAFHGDYYDQLLQVVVRVAHDSDRASVDLTLESIALEVGCVPPRDVRQLMPFGERRPGLPLSATSRTGSPRSPWFPSHRRIAPSIEGHVVTTESPATLSWRRPAPAPPRESTL